MATVKDHIDVNVVLNSANAPQASFGVGLFLVDEAQIPTDKRYMVVTSEDYDNLDAASKAFKYAQTYFGQKRIASKLLIGRIFEAASKAFWVSGPSLSKKITDWQAITTGSMKIGDGSGTEELTTLDFHSVTTMDQVLAVIQAKLDNASTVTGMVASIDLFGRLIITADSTTKTVTVVDASTGVSLSTVLDYTAAVTVASHAVETLMASTQTLIDMKAPFYNVNLRSSHSNAELVDFASWIETKSLLVDFVYTNPDAESSGSSADLGSLLKALNLNRSMVIYTQRPTEYPDAAVNGCVLPGKEGTVSWAWETLSLVTDSGEYDPLSPTVRGVLTDKNYTWLEEISNNVFLYDGITSGGEEKRIMLGIDWYEFTIQSKIFVRQLNIPLITFDNDTMVSLEGIVRDVSEEAVDRKIIKDTAKRPLTVSFPDADDISDAEMQTHKYTNLEAFAAWVNSSINDYKITGIWTR